jgi:hypothetical protein
MVHGHLRQRLISIVEHPQSGTVREEDISFKSGQLMCCVISSEVISRIHNLI